MGDAVEQITTSAGTSNGMRSSNGLAVAPTRPASASAFARVRLVTIIRLTPALRRCRAASSAISPAPTSSTVRPVS